MQAFTYKAVDEKGNVVRGRITASDRREAMEALHARGLFPVEVSRVKGKGPGDVIRKVLRRRITPHHVQQFFEALSVLVKAGVPLDRALSICREVAEDTPMASVVEDLISEIRAGASLSEALAKYPGIFDRFYVNMIRAGETGGVLPFVLERICQHIERRRAFREKLVSSLIYPSFLVLTAVVSLFILVVFVVPRFMVIFESVDVEPPFVMRVLSGVGGLVGSYWPFMLAAAVAAGFLTRRWARTEGGRRRLYRAAMGLPVVGGILVKTESMKLCGNLGVLLVNGVPMLKALSVVKEMFHNPFYREEVEQIYRAIREGERFSRAVAGGKGLWHPMVYGMAEVGEESGELGEMLIKVSEALEREVEQGLAKLVSLVEPATVLVMGLMVGGIVVSMLSAIFSINEMVR